MLRPVITIDEEKCNGCGKCITDCAEGALAIINGKATLISETYCDGLGACLNCPQDALKLEIQEAAPFDEKAAMEAQKQRQNTNNAEQATPLKTVLKPMTMIVKEPRPDSLKGNIQGKLHTWPLQLDLMPVTASFLQNSSIVLAAHCSGFAVPDIQEKFLKNKVPVIACPKLQDNGKLIEKLGNIIKNNEISSLEILRMSVPCCGGLERIVQQALEYAQKEIPVKTEIINL